ncbi:hypothetical protein FB451DRAFT_1562039 [Mycena latifolia]|nr:hypothetical protein FB451DRAFT_1562039 [Mycena latifolia]
MSSDRNPGEMLSLCAPEPTPLFDFGRLSQVCSSWDAAVMGTPSLWVDMDLSELSPDLRITRWRPTSTQNFRPPVRLPTKHSARWRTADIFICPTVTTYLSAAKGNLLLLEQLEIGGSGLDLLAIFEGALKLTQVKILNLVQTPQLSWHQLHEVAYEHGSSRFLQSTHDSHHLSWPRGQFGALALRSSFRNTLHRLSLYHVIMFEDELVQCLSEMQVLAQLCVQDVPSSVPGAAGHVLITNSLLEPLVWTEDSACLTPNFTIFAFASILGFNDNVLVDFVASRLGSRRNDDQPFTMKILWQPAAPDERDIDSVTAHVGIGRAGSTGSLNLHGFLLPAEDVGGTVTAIWRRWSPRGCPCQRARVA